MTKGLSVLILAATITGCTSVTVKPINANTHPVNHICIQRNPEVIVAGFIESIEGGLARHGITSERYGGDRPPEHCVYTLSYVARQHWDLATYLWLGTVEIRKGAEIVGTADYHLRNQGGLSLNKWKSVETKMRPVMDQLLANF